MPLVPRRLEARLAAALEHDHLGGPLRLLGTCDDHREMAMHLDSSLSRRALAAPPGQRAPRAKSEMSCGVAVSKPTTSSISGSAGSAIEKPFETMPTTTSRASIPEAWR